MARDIQLAEDHFITLICCVDAKISYCRQCAGDQFSTDETKQYWKDEEEKAVSLKRSIESQVWPGVTFDFTGK